jgi:hypothetical protein
MSATLPMKRSLAVTVVNAYYEIKKEGNNQENEEQFKKNFVKFIVPYMSNTYFTEEIAERLFMDIITLEDDKFSVRDENLFLSVKNYHYLNGIKNKHFDQTKKMMDIMAECDWVREEDNCYICGQHGYDINWPIIDEIGKFYYSIPGHINKPVCESCVKTNCLDLKSPNDDFAAGADDAENYGSAAYLQKYNLIKCEKCGNIWDGYAQCNCWQWNDYDERPDEIDPDEIDPNESDSKRYHHNIDAIFASWKEEDKQAELYMRSPPPDRPAPLPSDIKIKELEEIIYLLDKHNKILLEELAFLKNKFINND